MLSNLRVGERSKFQSRSIVAAMLYVLAVGWVALSFIYDVLGYPESEVDLFPRSGAILVLVAFLMTMVLRPKVEEAEFEEAPAPADGYNNMRNAPDDKPLPTPKPDVTNKLSKKLAWYEVFLGSLGTLIWAYGDLLVGCIAPRM